MQFAISRGCYAVAEDSMSQEQRALPLVEGGLRYTIHPVTGYLITTEVQPTARDISGSGAAAHREDKAIIRVTPHSDFDSISGGFELSVTNAGLCYTGCDVLLKQ